MFKLEESFLGREQERHRQQLAPYADREGRVPEPGDDPSDFNYLEGVEDWEDLVSRASSVAESELLDWRFETTGPATRTGFLLTATRECGKGRHTQCRGWATGGRFTVTLQTLDGAQTIETPAACACHCGHGTEARAIG